MDMFNSNSIDGQLNIIEAKSKAKDTLDKAESFILITVNKEHVVPEVTFSVNQTYCQTFIKVLKQMIGKIVELI